MVVEQLEGATSVRFLGICVQAKAAQIVRRIEDLTAVFVQLIPGITAELDFVAQCVKHRNLLNPCSILQFGMQPFVLLVFL